MTTVSIPHTKGDEKWCKDFVEACNAALPVTQGSLLRARRCKLTTYANGIGPEDNDHAHFVEVGRYTFLSRGEWVVVRDRRDGAERTIRKGRGEEVTL